jgi:hypothetical protein
MVLDSVKLFVVEMPKYTLTKKELHRHLLEQLQFLKASAAAYDNGFEGEAKRLATTIRVLLHDTKSSKSLLHQLGIKGALKMHNTAHPLDLRNLAPHQGLVVLRLDVPGNTAGAITFSLGGKQPPYTPGPSDSARARMTYVPRVTAPPRTTPTTTSFAKWWEEIVIKDGQGQTFSRKDLILALADKEGGAHVDPALDEQYARLTRFYSQGYQVVTGGAVLPPANSLVYASVRQIAHEVLVSIESL